MKKNVNNSENSTKVVCPVCGAEIAIAEHQHHVEGVAIGKDSGLGTVVLPLANGSSIEVPASANAPAKFASISPALSSRISKMESKGISTDGFFSIQNAKGEGTLMQWKNGVPTVVTEDDLDGVLNDPIANEIFSNGYVKNTKLHRRWIMAHVCHMLASKDGFNGSLRKRGYDYMWKMALEEFRVQSILKNADYGCFAERNALFPCSVAEFMIGNDIKALKKDVDYRKANLTRKCKGVPYIKIGGKNVFVDDIYTKVFSQLTTIQVRLSGVIKRDPADVKSVYELLKAYDHARIKLYKPVMAPEFVDAFKAAGAYYTCKNLIQFHGCQVKSGAVWQTTQRSLAILENKRVEYKNEGWRLFAFMKKLIDDNKFDFNARMAQLNRN